jgi:hypothetical protein
VTLSQPGGFEAETYTLLVEGFPSECSKLPDFPNRIYCTGPHVPAPGLVPVQLQAADASCTFDTPFDQISVIPEPEPEPPGKDY